MDQNKKGCINVQNDYNICCMYAFQCGVYEVYKKQHPERISHYDNDRSKKEIPAITFVNFEHCNLLMEIDDDINNSVEEFERDNGNKI